MKPVLTWPVWALLLSICFFSCGKVEDAENEITDPDGVVIELKWSNNATNPAVGTDLELYVRQNFKTLVQSVNYNAFESISIIPGLLNDGTYGLEVYVDDIDRTTNYTITVTGKSTNKSYSRNFGPINANDINSTLKPFSLTITGDQYRVF